ncbi:MAG TPA: cytochrome C oxidase subunit IV family protein [Bacteroidia bacterium]|jgi:cytochrome c oxidase subunit 4|nr:cytochrome C oxidase subunit IV family protein [Bacteroidia bacterium]
MDFFEEYKGYPNYEKAAIHDEAHGKPVRKKLWMVFWIMLGITIVELIIGSQFNFTELNKEYTFIFLTLVKAFFIVWVFMHLGDERRAMKYAIIMPYTLFIFYLAFMVITEGVYSKVMRDALFTMVLH